MAQKKGCCFFGCIGVVAVFIIAVIALGLGARWGFRKLMAWTDAAPMALPAPTLSPQDFSSLTNRAANFMANLQTRQGPARLALNASEINVLLTNLPSDNLLSRNFRVSIVSNEMITSAAIPLDEVPGPFKGRFMNLQAQLKPSIENGRLALRIADIRIRGKQPPTEITAEITKQNLAADLVTKPEVAAILTNLQSILVTNNTLLLISK
ncbi:MAG TPA: hypothetical protein VEH27_00190 [Methylomirabilota bacterium]|nr:hypothetical protein [Methylomirabilota bacterium]